MTTRIIAWTLASLRVLNHYIRNAQGEGKETFTIPAGLIDDAPVEFDRRYAEYLAEYLTDELKERGH